MYSQRDEEKHILEACAGVQRRRLLDIGAWHPIDKSNSRELIEQGWNGVLIEPSPAPVRELVREYGNREGIAIVCAAVSVEQGQMVRMAITDDAVSTVHVADAWKERGGYFGFMHIHSLTIADIILRWGDFDFVSIDTEGTSVDIAKVLLATEMFPTCICVEHDGRIVEMMQAARYRGYRPIYESEENLVFTR